MKHIRLFFALLLVPGLCLLSCRQQETSRLELALQAGGDNRAELEAVLSHYAARPEDSLHLKAARFLIENMPGHYTPMNYSIYYGRKEIDSLYPHLSNVLKKAIYNIPLKKHRASGLYKKTDDIKHIKSKYLIEHIDNAICMWHDCPWLHKFSFDEFCEYVLPYKVAYEPLLENDTTLFCWKTLASALYGYNYTPSTMRELYALQSNLLGHADNNYIYNLRLSASAKLTYSFNCQDLCYYETARLRAAGIPSAVDFIPYWPYRNGEHYWRVLFEPDFKSQDNDDPLNGPAAKVYRMTYSHNPIPVSNGRDAIPPLFQEPFYKDVTPTYVPTSQVEIDLPKDMERVPSHVYLAVFNDLEWKPIAWTVPERHKATFRHVGRNVVYLPVYFDKDSMRNAGLPFLLDHNGDIKPFLPDHKQPATLTLNRKYPLNQAKLLWGECLKGCYIEASDHADFSFSDTLYHINRAQPSLGYTAIRFPEAKAYRYWRIVRPKYAFQVSECQLFGPSGEKLTGKALSARQEPSLSNAFDGDLLTHTLIREWFGVDLGKSQPVRLLKLAPRTDDNGIIPGQDYELLYYDKDGWRSAGRQEAQSDELEFTNVPSGALYWLRNHTTGREERIFTYENGRMRFW